VRRVAACLLSYDATRLRFQLYPECSEASAHWKKFSKKIATCERVHTFCVPINSENTL
jgi:hypothetical protein